MLKKKIKKYTKDLNSDSSGLNCTTYDLTGNGTDKKSNCVVGIGMPTGLNNNNSDENLAVVVVEEEKLSKFKLGKVEIWKVINFQLLQLCVKNF
jgi:hypothetical protein